MAHPSWPWVEEQIAVALHKPNVYLDLSGWAPRYIPEVLIRETNTRLRDKVLFGSDFPYLQPDPLALRVGAVGNSRRRAAKGVVGERPQGAGD